LLLSERSRSAIQNTIKEKGVIAHCEEVVAVVDDPQFLFDGPSDAERTIALAHGTGASMDSPFMEFFAKGLGKRGFRVTRLEFPYMASKRVAGVARPPDKEPVLRETWLKVVKKLGPEGLVIGGKSMGGRIASLIADEAGVAGLVCLGYPFHPVGKPDKLRVEHLQSIKTPTLIVQGERDPFGGRDEVGGYKLSRAIRVVWMTDGEHSFKPRKSPGTTEQRNLEAALSEIVRFVEGVTGKGNKRRQRGQEL
jgi:predicted alpha/beta-hydrolase family hydrolase